MKLQSIKKPFILFLLIFLPVLSALSNKAEAKGNLPDIIAGLQTRYETITTLSAGFTQEVFSNSLQSSEHAQGTVRFKKPGMMRWDYTGGGYIISNGKLIWVYEPELAQVMEIKVDTTRPAMLTNFLSGINRLEKDFIVKLLSFDAAGYGLSLTPKRAMGNTRELLVDIDRDFLIKKSIAIDNFNNETRVKFHDIKINIEIPNDDFEYKEQKGIKLIRP